MNLSELEILEKEFDLFVALDDTQKNEFLFDASEMGVEEACIKQLSKFMEAAKKSVPKIPIISSEDYQVGDHRLCVTTLPNELYLNSNSLRAIHKFVGKLVNDGLILMRNKTAQKTEFDMYRFFRAYKIIGNGGPISSN